MCPSSVPNHKPNGIRAISGRVAGVLALVCLLATVYLVLIRPLALHWGATSEEVAQQMPEDGIVSHPVFDATRAITIEGRPEDIWPWLAQMGYRRAGYYGYDLIENIGSPRGIRSARTILPAFQNPKPGDELPISAVASIVYSSIQPGHFLVWRDPKEPPNGVFVWKLVPIDGSHTRLISRIRLRYHEAIMPLVLDLFTEFGDHVAVPKILLGVRDRVEGRALQSLTSEAAEIAAWLLALLELAASTVFIFFWRRWDRAWLLALVAGFLVQLELYGHLPLWSSMP